MRQESFVVEICGERPLIVHNAELLANPISSLAKAIKSVSGKKKKTDEDYEKMAELEWTGGIYTDDNNIPIMPAINLEAMIRKAAKLKRLGKKVQSAVVVMDNAKIIHDGPKDATAEDLRKLERFRDSRIVSLNGRKIIRTRPKFPVWSLRFRIKVNTSIINPDELREVISDGGTLVGCGTFTPYFGQYRLNSFTKENV